MNNLKEQFLAKMYSEQDIFVDKLGGTVELKRMTLKFNIEFNLSLSEDTVLRELTTMRKAGKLAAKGPKSNRVEKAGWPKPKDGKLEITIKHIIDLNTMHYIIAIMCYGFQGEAPTSRQEVYDFLQANPSTVIRQSAWWSTYSDEEMGMIVTITNRLFPDLK